MLDQAAVYMGGPVGARHLGSLPDERLLAPTGLSRVLGLRLIGSPEALERLQRLTR